MNKYAVLIVARKKTLYSRMLFSKIEKEVEGFADCFWVGYSTEENLNDYHYSKKNLESLGYVWMHEFLIPGHTGFIPMFWYKNNQQYDGVFVIEDDIRMRGNWRALLKKVISVDSDYVSTNIREYFQDQSWCHWQSVKIVSPVSNLFKVEHIAAFSPFFYLSKNGFLAADSFYRAGSVGHYEAVIPTAIKSSNLKISDLSEISGADNKYKSWYTLESFRFRPAFLFWGHHADLLYHPCKDIYYFFDALVLIFKNRIKTLNKIFNFQLIKKIF